MLRGVRGRFRDDEEIEACRHEYMHTSVLDKRRAVEQGSDGRFIEVIGIISA
jgi:hypothetical protein